MGKTEDQVIIIIKELKNEYNSVLEFGKKKKKRIKRKKKNIRRKKKKIRRKKKRIRRKKKTV